MHQFITRRQRTWDARTLWAHYRMAVVRTGGPDPGWPSDRELRSIYGDVRGNRKLIEDPNQPLHWDTSKDGAA